jgi:hypothetical protein
MRQTLTFIFISLVLVSCQMAKFDRIPGVEQTAYPVAMQGTYYWIVPKKYSQSNRADTLKYVITENTVSILDTSGKHIERKLGVDDVLSLVDDKYYVVSNKDRDFEQYWNCMVFESDKKSLLIYPVIDEFKKSILPNYFNKTFMEFTDAKDSIFHYKMDEKAFIEYFKKELKSDPIRLKRLN